MENKERILHLDIFDYNKRHICPLYDNRSNSSGQAVDIYVTTERNGWKELSFTLPSTCQTENGIEPNYRLDYLKADYLIRLIDEQETDWFIISEPKIIHNSFSKTFQVTAGHVSQLLKLKNLGLEFSDNEGNNVGTAQQLAETILAGTGWSLGYVYPFAEKDGNTKYRSLKASAKTGAFKLMAAMCDLFDAKPIYHGDSRKVDIVPINPFSEPAPGSLPDLSLASEVVELHYGKNVSNVTRTLNTENIVTKLHAYGSYGDKTSGYCGIEECKHTEYIYMVTDNCAANEVYHFTFEDASGTSLTYHFTPHAAIPLGSRLVFSLLDPCSMMYIWDGSNQNAYPVTKGTAGTKLPASVAKEDVQNWFQFVMDFDYYREVGLLTDDMIQIIADYQRNAPALYQKISDASLEMSEAQTKLSKTIGFIDFCKLDVQQVWPATISDYTAIVLDKNTHRDGVIYRSDYDKTADNRFKWRVTESLNTDGDPINSAAGIVYVIHATNPVTWDKAYLKEIDNEDDPSVLTLWAETGSMNIDVSTDQFYLFSYNGINGRLGTLESNDESALMSLEEILKTVTVEHPVIFTEDSNPGVMTANVNLYGWLWQYDPNGGPSHMYFNYNEYYNTIPTTWKYVYFQDKDPGGAEDGSYWFNWRTGVLKERDGIEWVEPWFPELKRISELFSSVYVLCKARDRYYQGVSENYTYTVPSGETLNAGNYFIENEYDSYWAFTTVDKLSAGDALEYNYDDAWVTQISNGKTTLLKPKGYRFDNVRRHPDNLIEGTTLKEGQINNEGLLDPEKAYYTSVEFIQVVPDTTYVCTFNGSAQNKLIFYGYDENKKYIGEGTPYLGKIQLPINCKYVKIGFRKSSMGTTGYYNSVVCAENIDDTVIIDDLNYLRLDAVASGDNIGLISCIKKLAEYSDLTYIECYQKLLAAQNEMRELEQNMMSSVGDLYREGWWQDANYVDGDEQKLYEDAVDNLNQIAKPEASYNITYLDTYQSNTDNKDFGASEETIDVLWPDVSINSAIHLVDPDIAINTWAFVDKLQKCYDKPWQTRITINTNLSTIAQHSFADVMTNIANVASEMKGKTSYYDKTLGTSASNDDVYLINAELSKSERELLSTISRVNEVDGVIIKQRSQIKQTEDMISAEVQRATQAEGKLLSDTTSLIQQTANKIQTSVSETYTPLSSAVSNVVVMYYLSSSTTELADGSWQSTAPEWVEGKYMWSKTVTSYANGTSIESDPTCIAGAAGVDGNGVQSITNYYLKSDKNSGVTVNGNNWETTPPSIDTDRPYLWNYEVILYTNGSKVTTDPCVIGRYGTDGDRGVGIESIEEYYAVSDSNTVAPTKWYSTPPTLTVTNKYLWNYEVVNYTEGDPYTSEKRIIGVYGDTGRGISNVLNYYLASNLSTGVTTSTSGWTTSMQSVTADKPYLWNYEKVVYTQGNPELTDPCIIGIYTEDGVSIISVVEEYAVTTSVNAEPTDWKLTPPTLTATNKYLWNRETINFSKGEASISQPMIIGVYGDKGDKGDDGKGIISITNYYLKSDSETGVTVSTSGWKTTPPAIDEDNPFLWNYEVITYTSGFPLSTTPCVIGRYGSDGYNGKGIVSIEEHYAVNNSATSAPTNWQSTPPTLSSTNKYLWNYEVITYTEGDPYTSKKRVIGVYGDKGDKGDDGRGISSVTNYYLATNLSSGVTTATSGWKSDIQAIDANKPYLWNYEQIVYTTGDPDTTAPCVIAKYTEDGISITSIVEEYATTTTIAQPSSSDWKSTPPTLSSTNKYLWNRETINFSNGKTDVKDPVIIGVYGDKGDKGDKGDNGRGVSDVINYYLASTESSDVTVSTSGWEPSMQAIDANKPYLWNYEQIKYTDGDFENTTPCIIARYTENGVSITEVKEEYATTTTLSQPASSEWQPTPPTITATNKYLWNRETIKYSNGESDVKNPVLIGAYGDKGNKGDTGLGVKEIKAQYYLSTSKTALSGGSWQYTMPTWSIGKYVWTRSEIEYTDGNIKYTEAYCDSGWEAANEKGKVWFQDEAPSASQVSVNDLWINTKNGANTPTRWNGSSWIAVSDGIAVSAQAGVTTTKNAITSIVTLGASSDGETLDYIGSSLQQTIDGFNVEITGKDKNGDTVESSLKYTVDGLSSVVTDIKGRTILEQTPESILAAVKTQNANAETGNEFRTSSVSISKDGVAISTDGAFSVSAGDEEESSAVKIDKTGVAIGSSGIFTVSSDNFGVNANGNLYANGAVINGQISNNGYPVLSKNYDIYIGSEAPLSPHVGMIWISPGVPESSGGSGSIDVPTNQTVTFTGTTNSDTRHWFYDEGSANVTLFSSNYSAGSKSSYSYSATIPIYLAKRSDGRKHGAKFKVSLNGSVVLSATQTWSGSSEGEYSVTLSGTSSVWLGGLSSITATISISKESSDSLTGNIYLDRGEEVTVTCS